ncbi:MAG: hypothetical protein ACREL3_04615 [Gemmatimonadales bacterium]
MDTVSFDAYPSPQGDLVMVEVNEGSQSAGTFELTAVAWGRVRCCFTPGPGVRIRDAPWHPG